MNFVNLNAPAASPADFARASTTLGCEVAAIRAVWQVETRGKSFDDKGRLAALFEPHHFWRLLGVGPKRDRAAALGLAYPKWGMRKYPADSYQRIISACSIDEEAALDATSWGGPQIMGFNAETCGYPSARAMVTAFLAGEPAQVDAFVAFVAKSGLSDEVRRKDWAGFARRYNGPGYAKNAYDKKLAQAYAHFKLDKPMAVMIAPLPAPGPMPSTQRADAAPKQSWLDRVKAFRGAA
jgi:hypothetical protein